MKIRDDIVDALNRWEVTIAKFLDYSKAFVDYRHCYWNLVNLVFLRKLLLSYLTDRKQLVQIDDEKFYLLPVIFGVPQRSVLDLIKFNIYIVELEYNVDGETNRYADDSTNYKHVKPVQIQLDLIRLKERVNQWSNHNNQPNLNSTNWGEESLHLSTCPTAQLKTFILLAFTYFPISYFDMVADQSGSLTPAWTKIVKNNLRFENISTFR